MPLRAADVRFGSKANIPREGGDVRKVPIATLSHARRVSSLSAGLAGFARAILGKLSEQSCS
jgi:hypothetical protein